MKKVFMVIPSFSAKGGIASVVSGYRGSALEKEFSITYFKTYRDGGKIIKLITAVCAYIKFFFALIFSRPDLVHIHSSFDASFIRKLPFIMMSAAFHLPVVNHIHGADFDSFYLNADQKQKSRVEKAYSKCDVLIALSDEWKERLSMIVPAEKVEIIENYSLYDEEAVRARLCKSNRFQVLFLGFIDRRKGCYDIPAVLQRVAENVSDVHFVLGGSGDEDAILNLIPERLRGNISFPGWVRGDEKLRLIDESDVFFLPSYNEGMPMAILDCMGRGMPIVSTDVGGIPKIVQEGENGFLLTPGDTVGMADAIVRLLSDDELRKSCAERSAAIVKEGYSLEIHLNKLREVYRRIAK